MELVDVYNQNREKITTKDRHSLNKDEYLIGVRAIILNRDNKILVTKRSENKKVEPLKWECNGGATKAGESSLEGIKRELNEELGLIIYDKNISFYKSIKRENEFTDIFIVHIDKDIDELIFNDNEVCEAKYVTIEQFDMMIKNNEMVSNEVISSEMIEEILEKDELIL